MGTCCSSPRNRRDDDVTAFHRHQSPTPPPFSAAEAQPTGERQRVVSILSPPSPFPPCHRTAMSVVRDGQFYSTTPAAKTSTGRPPLAPSMAGGGGSGDPTFPQHPLTVVASGLSTAAAHGACPPPGTCQWNADDDSPPVSPKVSAIIRSMKSGSRFNSRYRGLRGIYNGNLVVAVREGEHLRSSSQRAASEAENAPHLRPQLSTVTGIQQQLSPLGVDMTPAFDVILPTAAVWSLAQACGTNAVARQEELIAGDDASPVAAAPDRAAAHDVASGHGCPSASRYQSCQGDSPTGGEAASSDSLTAAPPPSLSRHMDHIYAVTVSPQTQQHPHSDGSAPSTPGNGDGDGGQGQLGGHQVAADGDPAAARRRAEQAPPPWRAPSPNAVPYAPYGSPRRQWRRANREKNSLEHHRSHFSSNRPTHPTSTHPYSAPPLRPMPAARGSSPPAGPSDLGSPPPTHACDSQALAVRRLNSHRRLRTIG